MNQDNSQGNYLNHEVEINGSIRFNNKLTLEGKIEGEIDAKGSLIIGKNGKVKGNIKAQQASIQGTVEGNISANEKVELKSNAKVIGDIKASKLAIEEGVTFCGKCEVNPEGVSAQDVANKFGKKIPEAELAVK